MKTILAASLHLQVKNERKDNNYQHDPYITKRLYFEEFPID
jgi:hypothetical protein